MSPPLPPMLSLCRRTSRNCWGTSPPLCRRDSRPIWWSTAPAWRPARETSTTCAPPTATWQSTRHTSRPWSRKTWRWDGRRWWKRDDLAYIYTVHSSCCVSPGAVLLRAVRRADPPPPAGVRQEEDDLRGDRHRGGSLQGGEVWGQQAGSASALTSPVKKSDITHWHTSVVLTPVSSPPPQPPSDWRRSRPTTWCPGWRMLWVPESPT